MARPRKCRRICAMPATTEFIPGGGLAVTDFVTLSIDEYEALRLIDYVGLSQDECSRQMSVARATVQQIYASARRKLAEALVEGYTLRIEGGDYALCSGRNEQCILKHCGRFTAREETAKEKGGNIMRIAVTYENGMVFQHFGHTEAFKVYDVEDGKVVMEAVVSTNGSGHGALADVLKRLNADILICGGIGGGAQMALSAAGIRFFGGVSGEADAAVQAYLEGKLVFNPNVQCSHHGDHHHADHACGSHGCGEHHGEGHTCGHHCGE